LKEIFAGSAVLLLAQIAIMITGERTLRSALSAIITCARTANTLTVKACVLIALKRWLLARVVVRIASNLKLPSAKTLKIAAMFIVIMMAAMTILRMVSVSLANTLIAKTAVMRRKQLLPSNAKIVTTCFVKSVLPLVLIPRVYALIAPSKKAPAAPIAVRGNSRQITRDA